jgi:hypothetical protein
LKTHVFWARNNQKSVLAITQMLCTVPVLGPINAALKSYGDEH